MKRGFFTEIFKFEETHLQIPLASGVAAGEHVHHPRGDQFRRGNDALQGIDQQQAAQPLSLILSCHTQASKVCGCMEEPSAGTAT